MSKSTFGTDTQTIENKTPEEPKKWVEQAVAWMKTDKNGNPFLSIKLKGPVECKGGEFNFKMFTNTKKGDNQIQPDFISFKE